MPADDSLGPDDRKCISQVRKQSMETYEYQPVETVEAQPLRRGAPEHDNLLPKNQNLGFK
jgi:hypothetical protein